MRDQPTGPLGPPSNGHSPNGHDTNGHATNGHAINGHATNGARADGAYMNGSSDAGGRLNGVVRHLPFRTLAAPDDAEGPPDLVAVQADDELINALGARPTAPTPHRRPLTPDLPPPWPGDRDPEDAVAASRRGGDDRLVEMLAAWRAEIDADPIPELVDVDTAVAAVVAAAAAHDAARRPTSRRRRVGPARHLAPLAAAAAIIVATTTGIALGSQNAAPGDTLWAIQRVVNPERAESVEAKVEVETRLAKVRTALRNGDTVTAAQELEAIRTQLPAVLAEDGLPLLLQEEEFLAAKLVDTRPGDLADLSTPPRSNPAARSTDSPSAPPGAPVVDPAPTGPGAADPVAPDVASVPAEPGGEAAVPVPPGMISPVEPGPDVSAPAPPVTSVPDDTTPESPAAPDPAPGSGNSEGGVDATVAPAPVEPPPLPPSTAESPPPVDTPTASGTTTASGSAGASAETSATATT